MGDFSRRSKVVVTCMKRLSPYVRKEIEQLGFPIINQFSTAVELEASLRDCIRLNLNLRSAGQVLYLLKSFRAAHPKQIYEVALQQRWEDWIPANGYFSVTSSVDHFTVNNPLFVNLKIKDAIADRFRRESGSRPNSGPELHRTVVHLHWHDEVADLFLDTSGETLTKHGYRKIPGKAPMLEALAAGVIDASGWQGETPFVNPMCGSGTLAIEAAWKAGARAPGLFRPNYAFMHLAGYEPAHYQQELAQAQRQVKKIEVPVIATDRSEDAVRMARINAEAAGVAHAISFQRCDFRQTVLPPPPGVVMFNPEYGERMGDEVVLEKTYKSIGAFLKRRGQGYLGFVFTGNLELAKKIGLRASRRTEFYNGPIECRLFQYEMYAGTRRREKAASGSLPQAG
jgi:putative N6-adenine-specific DNA methylase